MPKGKVAVIAGSESDRPVIEGVVKVLQEFKVEHDVAIISSHRDREGLEEYVKSSDADLFIGVAGLAAHLPGAIASMTVKPVIGVPVAAKLGGLDALLSIVQMPPGVPVACVAIDGGKNAALLALEMLSLKDAELRGKLLRYREGRR